MYNYQLRTELRSMYVMLRYVLYRTRTEICRSFLKLIWATDANGGGIDQSNSTTTAIHTTEQTASTTKLHSPLIRGIVATFVSEQSTDLSKVPKVVSSRFQTVKYCLPKIELMKTEVMSSLEVVSSRIKTVE